MNLVQALRLLPDSCLAFVGSGGKTTALFQVVRQLDSAVIVTATAHLAASQIPLADRHLTANSPTDLQALEGEIPAGVTLVTGSLQGDRAAGLSADCMSWLRAYCQKNGLPLLIEADGSRLKPLKAPAEHEPPIPPFCDTAVVVAGLSSLGHPLDETWVHRPELFQKLSASKGGQAISTEMIAAVLTHPQGGLKNIPAGARRVALLNQADTPELQAQARNIAERLLPAYDSVLIAALQHKSVYAVLEPVAGIVLAAGEARRFGRTKQLAEFRGQPFIRCVAQAALTAGLSPVVVVSGANAEKVENAVRDLPVIIVRNADWQAGQSSSIRTGLAQLPSRSGAVIFLLADQPQVEPQVLRALVEGHATDLPPILAPLIRDRRANPVLFDRSTFRALSALSGDVGGRAIFSQFPVAYLPWHDESLLIDVDRPEDLDRLRQGE